MTQRTESNPYKSVWNERNDYYGKELKQSGSAFLPTHLEMAFRSEGTSRYYLRKARTIQYTGSRVDAQEAFRDFLFYRDLAKKHLETHQRILNLSR